MKKTAAKQSSNRPATAGWDVKGDGVAFTTSKAIINSQAGRLLVKQAAQVKLAK